VFPPAPTPKTKKRQPLAGPSRQIRGPQAEGLAGKPHLPRGIHRPEYRGVRRVCFAPPPVQPRSQPAPAGVTEAPRPRAQRGSPIFPAAYTSPIREACGAGSQRRRRYGPGLGASKRMHPGRRGSLIVIRSIYTIASRRCLSLFTLCLLLPQAVFIKKEVFCRHSEPPLPFPFFTKESRKRRSLLKKRS